MRVLLIRESKGGRSLLVSSLKRQSVVSAWRLMSHSVIKKKKKKLCEWETVLTFLGSGLIRFYIVILRHICPNFLDHYGSMFKDFRYLIYTF